MNLDEIIKNRRSIRKFKDTPVDRAVIEACVEAARLAPSACNAQAWHFNIFDEEAAKEAFCDAVFTGIYKPMIFFKKAPVIIAVSASIGGNLTTRLGQMVSGTRFYLIDLGIACEHLVLKAQELGLGTCWIGWFSAKAAKKALKLPLGHQAEIIIALGYPDESPAPRPRKNLKEIITYNR
ncbi:MAG: nitroreductase family protein [Elusimicrobiota bacterium]|jgi:nitroreductase|nr:nitroreductase family protein [Elusimicrobiota bacterium]